MTEVEYIAKIALLESENSDLKHQVSALTAENVDLRHQLTTLTTTVSELIIKIEQLSVRKDSSNSSLPPSGDIHRKTRSLRAFSARKPGGQSGHKGTTLKMSESPDHIEPLIPSYCSVCARPLEESNAQLFERRQVFDIPPIEIRITEYQSFAISCTCGHHQVASFPDGVDNHIQYGPNIAALTVYNNIYQYIPYKRIQDFFKHVCQLPISVGTLENIVLRMAEKARPTWDSFCKSLEQSKVIGSDETSAKVNGKKQWIWVWQNAIITFLAVSTSRGSALVEELFASGFPLATVCSDRWKAQLNTTARNHQLCLAHLLRELLYLIQCEKTHWATQFKELLLHAIHLKQAQLAYPKDHFQTIDIEQQLDRLLMETFPDDKAIKTITFKKSMTKYREFILPFLYDPLVPYDNNGSERSIRNFKVKLKVSGQFKTGHEAYCILRSIIDTTIKNGQSVFLTITAIAHLKMPPKAAV